MDDREREKESWLRLGEDSCSSGEFQKMRACGREILDMDSSDPDGMSMVAEATLYLAATGEVSDLQEVEDIVSKLKSSAPKHLRGMLVKAELHWSRFELEDAMLAFRRLLRRQADIEQGKYGEQGFKILERGLSFYADACILAGEAEEAAKAAFTASQITSDQWKKAEFYSKGLFLSNYRIASTSKMLAKHKAYNKLLAVKMKFPHSVEKRKGKHSLRIGYISPDFRQHAAAYFFQPLFKYANRTDFKIYAYHTGKSDHITNKFRKLAENWRDMYGKSPQQVARKIFDDRIDILVDLSGHSQNNCLPVMAYKPAPVQISGIGYVNTTGLDQMDYFLSDSVCLPETDPGNAFSEETLRLPHCHLCYAPSVMREIVSHGADAPFNKNGYITFGSFNNFLKVTEDTLLLWRNILERVPRSKLIIKSKTCSVPSGQDIIMKRLHSVAIDTKRVELRPFSPDYLCQYGDIDICLDTYPYTGGLTTCDAIYMGVPVVTRRGRTHKSRFSSSILIAAGLNDLVVNNDMEYIAKAVQLAKNKELLNILHQELPGTVRQSRLMNGKEYMAELEEAYRGIWQKYCRSGQAVER